MTEPRTSDAKLTRLRDCWACGTGMDFDQKPKKCLACGADDPCGDGPNSSGGGNATTSSSVASASSSSKAGACDAGRTCEPVARTSNPKGDSWEENAAYLLNRCAHTIRVREGGGPENLLSSLVVTFMAMERKLEQRSAPETNERCMHGAVVCEKCASMAMRKVTPPVETQARLVREIRERHDRVSKLLWGPGAQPGMMLGPMDADAAHSDRGRLLSLLTPEQRGELKANACNCGGDDYGAHMPTCASVNGSEG